MENLQILLIISLIFSVIIHEVAHGLTALWEGDDTAKNTGRLTLNPIPHIDLVGTILVPAIFLLSGSSAFLAWAKPVPYNPLNLRDKKWGEMIVALAGPISNFILMFLFVILFHIFKNSANDFILSFLYWAGFMNLFLGIFNLIPIVPLDGSKVLFNILPTEVGIRVREFMEKNYLFIFLVFILIIFNTDFLYDSVIFIYSIFIK